MKKAITFGMLLFMITSTFSQQMNPSRPLTRQDYLEKSKNQKIAAWLLLAVGAPLVGTGLLIGNTDGSSFDDELKGAVIVGVGVFSVIGSVPLFIASGRNKRKAMNVSTYLEMRPNPGQTGTALHFRSSPALSLKLNF